MNNKISLTPVLTKPGRDTSGSALEFDPGTPDRARSFDSAMRNAERSESRRPTNRSDFGAKQRSAAAAARRASTAQRTDSSADRSDAAQVSEVVESEASTEVAQSQSVAGQAQSAEAERVSRLASQTASDSETISDEQEAELSLEMDSELDAELVSGLDTDEISETAQSAAAQAAQVLANTPPQEVNVDLTQAQLTGASAMVVEPVEEQRSPDVELTQDPAPLVTSELNNEAAATTEQLFRLDVTPTADQADTFSSEPEASVQSVSAGSSAPVVGELAGLIATESNGEEDSDSDNEQVVVPESTEGADEASVDLSADETVRIEASVPLRSDQQLSDAAVSLIGQSQSTIDLDAPAAESVVESMNLSAAEAAELAQAEAEAPAGDAVSRQVQRAIGAIANIGEGDHEFKIRLTPKELGSITIDIKASENGLAIALVTETSAANDRLNEQRQQLLQELAESGLDSSSVDISQQGQDFGSLLGNSMAGNSQGSSSDDRALNGTGSDPSGSNQTAPSRRLGINRASSSGRLDISL